MAKRSIVWTDTAARQRREILKYWTIRNGSDKYARKLIEIIKAKVKTIAKHPESSVMADYGETRMSSIGHFSIYYKVSSNAIIIVAFWDNRQDPASLLEIIKEISK